MDVSKRRSEEASEHSHAHITDTHHQPREYALVSGSDPLLKDDTRRIEGLDLNLPRWLGVLAGEGGLEDFIYVRVVRPSGPTYSVIDFPGAYNAVGTDERNVVGV